MMTAVSVFKNFSNWVENKELDIILDEIKTGKFKREIDSIRNLLKKGQKENASILKSKLLAFTVSGNFKNERKAKSIISYSKLLILDIDKLSESQLDITLKTIKLVHYTYAAFISPSGNGIKVVVKVDSDLIHHKKAFDQVVEHYDKSLNIEIDISGSDVSRLCFVSFDPDCYINTNADIFNVQLDSQETSTLDNNDISNIPNTFDLYQKCIDFTNKITHYHEGNRNNYIHQLACNCNRIGIIEVEAEKLIMQDHDLNPKEIKSSVHSAYKNNIQDFAKFANLAKPNHTNAKDSISKEDTLFNMPFLPDDIFPDLPTILFNGCQAFSDKRERDVFFTGALSILSGCMVNVSGGYRGKQHYANLFCFIIAPAASGKGALTFSKDLGEKYHDKLVSESREKQKAYEVAEREYKKMIANKKVDITKIEPPEEPPFKVLFIPANNSSARVIQHLKEGDEQGIFCETEADSMGNVLKQDWGSYSDLLRKAFHHEPITYSRKTNKEWVEIKQPRLSVALAGTPGQVQNLIKSAEDGLFSRFLFYTFKSELKWIDAGETLNGVNLTKWFDKLSDQVLNFVEYLDNEREITFKLTESQWKEINIFGSEQLYTIATFISEDLSSTIKRLGLIIYRISMILTALRYFDNGESSNQFICEDNDFKIALKLVRIYQEHAVYMFKELPKEGSITDKVLKTFFDTLPVKFQRKNAVTIANKKLGIKERTADLYLSKLVSAKFIEKIKSGFYQKLK